MPRGRQLSATVYVEPRAIGNVMQEFFRHNQSKGLATETQKAYRTYVGAFAKWYGLDNFVSNITPIILEDYICKCQEDGIKMVSIATYLTHIRVFIKFCVSRGYMTPIEVTIPKYETEVKEPYTEEEMKLLLKRPQTDNWAEYRNWVMVNYFFATGQRLSTVLNIKVRDLDLKNSKVKLTWNKDKIQKYMPLSSAIVSILQEYILVSILQPDDYLFPEYEGNKFKRRGAEDAIGKYNRSRGVNKTSIHLFRHTFAKEYIQNGGNAVKLQQLMNHKSLEQTMKYVNLYRIDYSKDLDMYNPLDNFNKRNYAPMKRTKILGVSSYER